MLKINEEKFMQDYNNIVAKKESVYARCRSDAAEVGALKGYDEDKIERLYKFLITESADEFNEINREMEFYAKYLDEVAEPVETVQPALEIPSLPVQENM